MNALSQTGVPPDLARVKEAERRLQISAQAEHFHPLEVFEVFRRWPRSFVRNFVYTLLLNACFAVLFMSIGLLGSLLSGRTVSLDRLADNFGTNFIISNVIGFTWWGSMHVAGPVLRWVNTRSYIEVVLFYAVTGTVIVTGSFFFISFFPGFNGVRMWLFSPEQLTASFLISLVVSFTLATIWRRRAAELASHLALAEERERVQAAERAATQASLRALQAQIEPHFLFNTLANVTSLIHTRPDDAKHMLEEFIAYLRASLASTREAETVLAKEFELMRRFLSVLEVRMGKRLASRFALPDTLQQFALPSMLIQPLVENAIKHGLEPKIEGGEVVLSAEHAGDMVRIVVADTGMGFKPSGSNGIGLANVRERLERLYDGRASLSIEDNAPCGTRFVMSIPVVAREATAL
jgi:signal transduction histidine kinase